MLQQECARTPRFLSEHQVEMYAYGWRTISSNTSFLGIDVEVPIDAATLAVALFKPLITLSEVVTLKLYISSVQPLPIVILETYESPRRAQRAWMHALQDKMLIHRNALRPVLRRRAPSQKHNAMRSHL